MEGTQFEFSYADNASQQQMIAFEMAGELWSQYLTDDVTINVHVEVTNLLPDNVIGGALPGMKKDVEYKKVYEELSQDITTGNDWYAVDSLLNEKEFSALVNGESADQLKKMKLTNANLKALDLINGDKDRLDGYILMSDLSGQSNVQWDYDVARNGDIAQNKLDFLSVAVHEVGHVLGFTSSLDDGDWLHVITEARDKGEDAKGDDMKFFTPLDLFRYSSRGQHELTIGRESYFSIDGGRTNLANFSTGESDSFNGDGYQASHWKHDGENILGIMDPVLKLGARRDISSLDIQAMDVTGWDVVDPGQLDWEEMYADAEERVEDAYMGDRTKDVEKMIKDPNNYHGRRSRSRSRGGYHRQEGLWQNIRFQTLDNLDLTVEVSPGIAGTRVFVISSSVDRTTALENDLGDQESASNSVDFSDQSLLVTTTDAVVLEVDSQMEFVNLENGNLLENRWIPENAAIWDVSV
ncbi:MAG: NF038122 family metalloprotease [Cyanobacteria bacterium J06600_6]